MAGWLDRLLRQAGRADLAIVGANVPLLVAVVSAATVGVVLASRRPRHPVGWLLLAVGLSEQFTNLLDAPDRRAPGGRGADHAADPGVVVAPDAGPASK